MSLLASLLWFPGGAAASGVAPEQAIADADALGIPFQRSFVRSAVAMHRMSQHRDLEAMELFGAAIDIARASGNLFAERAAQTMATVASSRLLDVRGAGPEELARRARHALEIRQDFSPGFVTALIGLTSTAQVSGRGAEAAAFAGYLDGHPTQLGMSRTTVEFICGRALTAFVAPSRAVHDRRRSPCAARTPRRVTLRDLGRH